MSSKCNKERSYSRSSLRALLAGCAAWAARLLATFEELLINAAESKRKESLGHCRPRTWCRESSPPPGPGRSRRAILGEWRAAPSISFLTWEMGMKRDWAWGGLNDSFSQTLGTFPGSK